MTIPSSAWEDSYRARERVREKKGEDRENSSTCWPIDKLYYYRPSKITRSASHQITPYKNSNVNATSRNRACSYCAPRFRNGSYSRVPRDGFCPFTYIVCLHRDKTNFRAFFIRDVF